MTDESAHGTKALRTDQWANLPVPVPDTGTQERIANFLDEQTARIDALIAEKERLLAALDESLASEITYAVTGSTYPGDRKLANAEWLGKVPCHWSQTRVNRVCTRVTDGAHISPDLSSADYHFVSTVDIKDGVIRFDGSLQTSASCYEYLARTGCQPRSGDVLFSKDGTIGRTVLVPDGTPEFVVASSLIILSPDASLIRSKFLEYWLNSSLLKQHYDLQLAGAALRRISVEKVSRLPLLLPPPAEQQAIEHELNAVSTRVRSFTEHATEHIDRLREYRSSLISAAVTGQLDLGTFKAAA